MATVNEKMTVLADEVRTLSGTTTKKSLDTMTTDINAANTEIAEQTELLEQIVTALEGKASDSGGVTLPTLNNPASASTILNGYEAIDSNGNKITGIIPTKTSENLIASGATVSVPAGYYDFSATKSVSTATQATPSISVSNSGLITASATQTAGYVTAGTKSGTKQLTTQAAKTVTPTTSNQTAVASGIYTTGAITVKGDNNLKAENIKSGVSIFGVAGSYEGESGGGGASIETCTVNITSDSDKIENYMFVTFENNQIGYVYEMTVGSYTSTPVTISNVVCGSIAYIMGTYTFTGFTTNNCEKIEQINPNSVMIKFTADANGTATIHMFDDD